MVGRRREPLIGARTDVESPQANAVVRLGGCTGTLIAPNIVVTAQHCIGALDYPHTEAFTAKLAALAFSRGAVYVVAGSPERLWRRDIGAPFMDRTAVGGFGPFSSLAPLTESFLGTTDANDLVEFDATDAPGETVIGSVPTRVVGMATVGGHVYAATHDNRLLHADSNHRPMTWEDIGHANHVSAMTAVNGSLFVTADDRLWMREPVRAEIDWTEIGHANSVIALAAFSGRLLAQTSDGGWWLRWPVPWDTPWQYCGSTRRLFTAIAAEGSSLRGTTSSGQLWLGDVSVYWEDVGPAPNVVSMTALAGELFAATSTNRLVRRPADRTDSTWQDIGHANNVVGLAGRRGELVCLTSDRRLWHRYAHTGEVNWTEIPEDGSLPSGVTGLAVLRDGSLHASIVSPGGAQLWRRANLDSGRPWTTSISIGENPVGLASNLDRGPGTEHPERLFALTGRLWFHPVEPSNHYWLLIYDDWLAPERWYAYREFGTPGPTVRVGLNANLERRTAIEVLLPGGWNDIALLRLDQRVDPRNAVPTSVLTAPPDGSSSSFWRAQAFTVAGWGGTPATPTQRQIGQITGGGEYPMGDPGGYLDWNRMRVTPRAGEAAPLPGDSGGPLIWADSEGTTQLIGACNVAGGGPAVYYLTFSRGSTDTAGIARPNIGAWIEGALAGQLREPPSVIREGDWLEERGPVVHR